jgi:glycosidase
MASAVDRPGATALEPWPRYPFVYEIDTWPWLRALSAAAGGRVDLAGVPARVWDEIAAKGIDAVWLMGVWERSPAGVQVALSNPELVAEFERTLADYRTDDVVGSPYCVRNYSVDERLGGTAGLATARRALAERGMRLVLDFVPNHVAPDHPWTVEHPDRFVTGTRDDLRDHPDAFVEVAGQVLANGRDPYFPAWRDVVQLNAFAPGLRAAAIDTLRAIAGQCDGVRCDMAMLMMNDTFERTWGGRVGAPPTIDYWPAVVSALREVAPEFRFIAEAYWDLEYALQQQGFDYCYDKRLYDRLLHDDAESVREHLMAEDSYQARLIRFVENHDEPRIASLVDGPRARALAIATFTQMGARLVHDGQEQGRRVHEPVFLDRYPDETRDKDLEEFYQRLWSVLRDATFRRGTWQLCDRSGWDGSDFMQLVSWCWSGDQRWLVVVNLGNARAAGNVHVPWADLRGREWNLVDDVHGITYRRDGDTLCDGLYVELEAWGTHLFRIDELSEDT